MIKAKVKLGDKTETEWELDAKDVLMKKFGFEIVSTKKESVAFTSSGIRYTPDFMHILKDGGIVFVEVKTSRFSKSYVYSKTRLRVTAANFPWFVFLEALKAKNGWAVTEIKS